MSISIKGNNSDDPEADYATLKNGGHKSQNQEFTNNDLVVAWNKLADKMSEEQIHLAQTLKSHQPVLDKNGSTILVTVHNNIQEKRIQEEQELIMGHLKNSLKNDAINISIVVDETVQEKKYYTNSEKLQMMIQKNPDLNFLRKKFDLDLE